jgi:hypothetical protein
MIEAALLLLVLFQLKHWYIDFVDQDMDEVNSKGHYGQWLGIRHSLKQGLGTYIAVALVVGAEYWIFAMVIAFVDFVIHYHTDWAKMNYGNRDIQTPEFWAHLGLDQMVHQVTYILLTYMVCA